MRSSHSQPSLAADGGPGTATDGGAPAPAASLDRDAVRRVRRLRRFAYLLDSAVRVPGTRYRIGLDPLLGVLPVGGDVIGGMLSLAVVAEAYRLGAPPGTLARMFANVVVEVVLGAVPVAGDLFDAAWKANERNVRLVERHVGLGAERASASPPSTAD